MEIWVFGREECPSCKAARKTINEFIENNGICGSVKHVYYDMDTVDGCAEGAFNDVRSVPTTIVCDNGESIARWDGAVPQVQELSLRISQGRCSHK